MRPVLHKTESLDAQPDRETLHEIACRFVEERFKLKGELSAFWIVAVDQQIAFTETAWANSREKDVSVAMMRFMVEATGAHAYSFVTEAWIAAFENLQKGDADRWIEFCNEHGVSALPEKLRDDVALVLTFDKQGGVSSSRYIVNQRRRGPNYLGVRVDEDRDAEWGGRMGSLFK